MSGFSDTSAILTGDDEKKVNLEISGGKFDLTATGLESSTIGAWNLKISGGDLAVSAIGDDAYLF